MCRTWVEQVGCESLRAFRSIVLPQLWLLAGEKTQPFVPFASPPGWGLFPSVERLPSSQFAQQRFPLLQAGGNGEGRALNTFLFRAKPAELAVNPERR